jgi:hypothetical protein
MSCGVDAVPDEYAENYVFYHEQDADDLDAATTLLGPVMQRQFATFSKRQAAQSSTMEARGGAFWSRGPQSNDGDIHERASFRRHLQ